MQPAIQSNHTVADGKFHSQTLDIKHTTEIETNEIQPPEFQGDFAKALFLWNLKNPISISSDAYDNSCLLWEGGICNCFKSCE